MTRREGPGLGKGMLGEDLQVVLILGTAAATAATAQGLGFRAGWLGPHASAGAARARKHAAPEMSRAPVRRGSGDEEDRGGERLGEVPVMPGAEWIEGQSVLLERTSSWMEDKRKVFGSKRRQ